MPVGFEGTDVRLYRASGVEYSVEFSRAQCTGVSFCVYLERLGYGALNDLLNDPIATNIHQVHVGTRTVWAMETGHSADPALLAWREQGRTYMAVERYVGLDEALPVLTPLVESLQPLPVPPPDPCAGRWPTERSVRHKGGRLIYDRHTSLRKVCEGFGTDTGGLHIHWLTWGMKCALVAVAIGARYGDDAEFLANGACAAAEVIRHPSAVSAVGAVCSTASNLLGLKFKTLGRISGLACEAAPSVGDAFGTKLESHHEFAVAKDVTRKGRCLEYRYYLHVSSWHAVRCPA